MMQLLRRRKAGSEEGFTLIELLVVIIILGILAAVVVFAVGGIGDKGQDDACRIDTRTIRTAEEAHAARNNGNYATEEQLRDGGFLSQVSTLHTVGATEVNNLLNPKSFTIKVEDPDCGTPGAPVDGNDNL